MFARVTCLAVLLTVFLLGCAHRVETFKFENRTDMLISADIYGFEDNLPVGEIYPSLKGGNIANMHPMRLPEQVMIAWNENPDKNTSGFHNMDNLSLTSLTNWSRDATLVFEFESNRVWRAFYEQR